MLILNGCNNTCDNANKGFFIHFTQQPECEACKLHILLPLFSPRPLKLLSSHLAALCYKLLVQLHSPTQESPNLAWFEHQERPTQSQPADIMGLDPLQDSENSRIPQERLLASSCKKRKKSWQNPCEQRAVDARQELCNQIDGPEPPPYSSNGPAKLCGFKPGDSLLVFESRKDAQGKPHSFSSLSSMYHDSSM